MAKEIKATFQPYVGNPVLEPKTLRSTTQLIGMAGGEVACRAAHMGNICSTRKPLTLSQQQNIQDKRCLYMAPGTRVQSKDGRQYIQL